ncbi:hypothetical protein [Mesobacillus foraminis]|uniref:Uncharacterized protein n=1 Tax=Mesobacillus foraminis TaxID=279826 RepID=A0A4R2B8E2_9BACI|nr:hypothetical protein [Mesobacillus foraminis]TCN22603.1 hypothetical protein EV146_11088 [Mesobacillus foraminis]
MKIKSGIIDQFEHYSHFASLKEFNTHMELWLAVYKYEFSKGELVGLKRLARFAAKKPGVCNAKIGTMLKAIHEEYAGNGISRSTFKRMIQRAISLGILTVHETERKNGSQSSNLYVFNRFPASEPPKEEKLNHPNKTISLPKTKNQENNKRKENVHTDTTGNFEVKQPDTLDDTFTSDRIPVPFKQAVAYFFPEVRIIEEYWKMARIAAYRNNYENDLEKVVDTAIPSFKQMISKLKAGSVRNPISYYFGILMKKFEVLYFEELFDMGFCEGEWS